MDSSGKSEPKVKSPIPALPVYRICRRPTRIFFLLYILSFVICLITFSVSPISAQEADDDQEIAPPPLKLLSKDERSQLSAQTEVKKRTKLALELMEARIKKSEELQTRQEYYEMFKELGGFHAVMDNMLEFLDNSNKDSGKVLNNFKRLEIGLREFRPRLEMIRRDLPLKYETYVRNLVKYVRDARARAVEPFFSDTVLPRRKT